MKTKKTIALVLALLMVWLALPLNLAAAAGSPDIVLGTSKIRKGNTVWFANYSSAPVNWRVMGDGNDSGGNSRLLLYDRLLTTTPFNPRNTNNVWQGSTIQTWCKNFYKNNLSAGEKSALIETSRDDAAYVGEDSSYGTSSLKKEYVFCLSAEEAEVVYFTDRESRKAKDVWGKDNGWWLRSPATNGNAGEVDQKGYVYRKAIDRDRGARPAFNLNLSSVLFTSAATGGKPTETGLSKIVLGSGTEWKLTLLDESRHFSASTGAEAGAVLYIPEGDATSVPGSYSGAMTGANEKISALLCKDGEALYYGQIADAASGTQSVNVTIPAGLDLGEYQLKLFNEQVNGDKKTDYASAFSEFTIRIIIPVTDVHLDKTAITLVKGNTKKLIATIEPDNATIKDVEWETSDPTIATVDDNGTVTAVSAGKATITVITKEGRKTDNCVVTVQEKAVPVTCVRLNKICTTLAADGTEVLIATVVPADATNQNVTWDTSDPSVATVDANGVVKAEAPGIAVITVTTEDGGKIAFCFVTVFPPDLPIPVLCVKLNKIFTTLTVGSTETLTATITPASATNQNVTWSTSAPRVATVDANGMIKAEAPGIAIITVTTEDGRKTAFCTVTVTQFPWFSQNIIFPFFK